MSYSRGSRYDSRSPIRRSSRSRYRSRSRSVDPSDAENPGNNLYVTGLSARVTDRDLEKHFSAEGEVIDASVVLDPWTRESRGFGFVTMATVKEADRCIKYLDRSVLEGRVITVEKILDHLITHASDINVTSLFGPVLFRQRGDEVEPQHLGSILVQSHHVGEDIPRATHLFGGTDTVHATHLIVNGLTLLMAEKDHTRPMIEDDLTHPMTGDDRTHLMTDADHTRLTTAHDTVQGLRTGTAQDLRTGTAQGRLTDTEDGGPILMTGLFHPTTEGAIIGLFPGHQVLLRGPEEEAILAVCHRMVACRAAVPPCQKDPQAILQRKGTMMKRNGRAAGLQARGVVQGKATHTAVVLTHALYLGSDQPEMKVCHRIEYGNLYGSSLCSGLLSELDCVYYECVYENKLLLLGYSCIWNL